MTVHEKRIDDPPVDEDDVVGQKAESGENINGST
jgi:hypothetical protein